jgi:phage shock protein C
LYRDTRRAGIAGVCAGIADHFGRQRRLGAFPHVPQRAVLHHAYAVRLLIAALVLQRKPEHLYSSREEELSGARSAWSPAALRATCCAEELERRLRAAEARVTSSESRLRRQFKDLEG